MLDKGILYCVSVGSGDYSLLTLKAQSILERTRVIFTPIVKAAGQAGPNISHALDIVAKAIDLSSKELYYVTYAMQGSDKAAYTKAARDIASILEHKGDVAYLCLGDSAIYGTAYKIEPLVRALGYKTAIIPGVNSFSAAASTLHIPLCSGNESLTVVAGDAAYTSGHMKDMLEALANTRGTLVIMKAKRQAAKILALIEELGLECYIACNVGTIEERLFSLTSTKGASSLELPYLSLIIVKA